MSEARSGLRMRVAYDGAGFSGWQVQPDRRTVQGVLAEAVSAMQGQATEVRGAGRTDAGVHAEGQVAAFDAVRDIPPRGWMLGLNQRLPDDVAVRAVEVVELGYDPRFDAVEKTYRYLVQLGEPRSPLCRRRAWHVPGLALEAYGEGPRAIDLEAMRAGAAALIGTHDFQAFRAADDGRDNTVRTLHEVSIEPTHLDGAEVLAITVRGTAFLKQMVRILAGTLVQCGRGKVTPAAIAGMLGASGRRQDGGPTAPAHGLTLVAIQLGREASR